MPPESSFITVAPNGARRMPQDHIATPITPAALADCAAQCLDAGAAMIHMHARDAEGQHTLDPHINQRFHAAVRAAVGSRMIIQVSTEAVSRFSVGQQLALVEALQPEAISMALGELIRSDDDIPRAAAFLKDLAQDHTFCQIILYSPEQVRWYKALKYKQVIPERGHHVLFVIGRHTNTAAIGLSDFLAEFDFTCRWGVCAFGEREYAVCSDAIAGGGDPRVGFENNLLNRHGLQAKNNAELVAQMDEVAEAQKIKILTADEVRQQLSEPGKSERLR